MTTTMKKTALFFAALAAALMITLALDSGQANAYGKTVGSGPTYRKCTGNTYTCINSGSSHYNVYRVQNQSPYYGSYYRFIGRFAY